MKIGKSLRRKMEKHKFLYLLGLATVLVVLVIGWFLEPASELPSFIQIKNNYLPSDLWMIDHKGYPLEAVRLSTKDRSLDWVPLSAVSPVFKELLIKTEDRRFYSHWGVDTLAIIKALWERTQRQSIRGASTITMQLVGLVQSFKLNHRRNWQQKLQQIISAIRINIYWSKEEVLEAYINLIPFRGELVGLHAASMGYFRKHPLGLLQQEAALLIALLRSPNAPIDLVTKRACIILSHFDCTEMKKLAQQIFSRPYELARSRELVPILSSKFILDSGSYSNKNKSIIRTTLDYQIQEMSMMALREQLRFLKRKNVNDGAVLVLETKTGRVVAYAANAGSGIASAAQIDGIQMRRQAGSTLKPFIYGTAFDLNILTPGSLLEDAPLDITVSYGKVYHPKNYDHIFRGLVSAGEALGSSLNVPAVRALQLVGEGRVLDKLRGLGFSNLQEEEYYGPSLALGTVDVSLWELAHGYRQLALENSQFSKSSREFLFNILTSPEYRRFTFGMDSILSLPFPAAVKTGTSKDMRDNWCVGWTPQYTIGVWVGNFNGEPMWNVSGLTGAAPIWRSLMLALHNTNTIGGMPVRHEEKSEPLPYHTLTRIRYPVADMLIGWDPDIPKHLQKIPIEIENPQQGQKLFLNHKLVSSAREVSLIPVVRGKYSLDLKSKNGELLDSLKFEVR